MTKAHKILALCQDGATIQEIRAYAGGDSGTVLRMKKAGLLFPAGDAPRFVYFASRTKAEQYKPGSHKPVLPPDEKAEVQITWPSHVKVQVCPAFEDKRFKFVPPSSDWTGEITKDRRALGTCK